MKVLLDNNSSNIKRVLATDKKYDAYTCEELENRPGNEINWSELQNGALLDEAKKEGFQVMITKDKNIPSQQNLEGRIPFIMLAALERNKSKGAYQPLIPKIKEVLTNLEKQEFTSGAILIAEEDWRKRSKKGRKMQKAEDQGALKIYSV